MRNCAGQEREKEKGENMKEEGKERRRGSRSIMEEKEKMKQEEVKRIRKRE
jgi:hypothetical protein